MKIERNDPVASLLTRIAPDLSERRFPVEPSTIDPTARTVQVVVSTGAGVARQDAAGGFVERLAVGPANVRLHQAQIPVLDSHRQGSVADILGTVLAITADGERVTATVKIADDVLWQKIVDGTVRSVSAGYTVEEWADSIDPASGQRTKTATKWTLAEVSFVAVPADPAAMVRNAASIVGLDATETERAAALASTGFAPAAAVQQVLATRAAPIRTATASIVADHEDPRFRGLAMGAALAHRLNPRLSLPPESRRWAGLTMVEMARESCRRQGLSTTALSPSTIVERALTTSDFPLAVEALLGNTLRPAYMRPPSGIKKVAFGTTVPNFDDRKNVAFSHAPTLEKVNESGEFKHGAMAEDGAALYRIATFGRIIGVSRQLIIGDKLGLIAQMAARMGSAAADFEDDNLIALLVSNSGNGPTMEDSNPVFHSTHGNMPVSGAAPDETTVSAARLAMRKQTDQFGKLVNIVPRWLMVPPDLETKAEKFLATINPMTSDDVNPFSGKLELIVEPRLTNATRWYLIGEGPGLEYAHLEGEPQPELRSEAGFTVDGVQTRVRLDFGSGFVDWRTWYMNPGQ